MTSPVHVVEMSPAEREHAFAVCRELADEFRAAGPRHDAENTFPHEMAKRVRWEAEGAGFIQSPEHARQRVCPGATPDRRSR